MRTSWSKWTGTLLATTVLAGAVWGGLFASSAQAASPIFSDVKANHWAASSIAAGAAKGYVAGYTNGTFKPDASVTRSEFVKMVVSALDLEVADASGKWYAPYVTAATGEGLYQSADFANNDAAWNKTITRQEMARIAARAAGETTKENDKWMYLATKKGLITGVGKGEIALEGLSTRAQAVVVIERILSANEGEKLSVDTYAVGSAEIAWHGTNLTTVLPEPFPEPEEWQESNMIIDSKDGMYKGKLNALIVIDLEDKNDPNRSLLGDVEKLRWHSATGQKTYVKDVSSSYIFYFAGHPIYNKNEKAYVAKDTISFAVAGFNQPNADFFAGKLNTIARVYKLQSGDFPALILPKSYVFQPNTRFQLQTPAYSNYGYKVIDLIASK